MALSNNTSVFTGKKQSINYTLWLSVAAVAALLIGGSFFGYRWYVQQREEKAQKNFSDCMQEYMQAQAGRANWENVAELCKLGYERNSSAYLAPYFISLHAEALLQQDKRDEAVVLLDSMLAKIAKSSPVYGLFGVKRALINLDMADAAAQQKGVEQLKVLADDTKNMNRDIALYYLGLYQWSHDEVEPAKKTWQELITLSAKDQRAPSPWAALAENKMKMSAVA